MALADALTRTISQTKRRMVAGGVLQEVEWRRRTGEPDVRGRYAVTTTLIDAFIEARPALDYNRFDTERADDTVLTILDPLAITDEDTFRWATRLTPTRCRRLMALCRMRIPASGLPQK